LTPAVLPDLDRGLITNVGTGDASVRLDGVSRRYGAVRALDRLSLDLPDGKFITLLGPSGCGKTTTLSLIAGLDQPDEGSIYLGDRDITRVPPNERGMAIVFQNYALYPHMSVFGNLAFSLKLQRRSKPAIQQRVYEVAEILSIEHLLKRKPGQLSGGQQQRVAIGRALVKEPSVYLLDEPFSNLDAALRTRMRTEIKRLHLSLGTTSIFVTHDQEEAMTLSDFVAVMRDGKLVQYGTQNDVYFRPHNTYVATFLGKPRMSLVAGSLEHHDDGVEFVGPDLRLGLGPAAALGLRDGTWDRVLAGVRAEDVSIVPGADASPLSFKAQVQLLEPMGSDTFVELVVGSNTVVARVAPDLPLSVGDNVLAQVRPGRTHLFDTESTERITN
jgi:multiple sugar transport system ATP-binding protein